ERPWQPFRRYGDDGDRGKRSPGEGDGRTVRARERDGYLAAITAVGNTGRCHCFSADYAAPGGRFFARVSPLGVARPDETTGCVGVSDRRAQRSSASLRLSMWPTQVGGIAIRASVVGTLLGPTRARRRSRKNLREARSWSPPEPL